MQAENFLETLQWMEAIGVNEPMALDPFDKTVSLDSLLQSTKQDIQEEQPKKKKALTNNGAAQATLEAKKIAQSCDNLESLKEALSKFEGCALKATATNLVFGDGNSDSNVMFIGDAPNEDDDRSSIPFSKGIVGDFLSTMLSAIDLKTRDDYYMTHMVNWRPPGNREPSALEVSILEPFVKRHIELVNPKLIVFIGSVAAKAGIDETSTISKLRGKWHDYHHEGLEKPIKATALFHPTYLSRQAGQKKKAWSDLIEIKKFLADQS